MGIRFSCPNGHKLNVKTSQAGKRALCPACGVKVLIPDAPAPPVDALTQSADGATPSTPAANAPVQAVTESAMPSIVIPLDESISTIKKEAIPPAPLPSPPPVPTPTSEEKTSAPNTPQPVTVASQPPAVVAPGPPPPDVQYQIRRERRRRNQVRIAVALLVMVIMLGIALIWVLRRNAALAPPDTSLQEKTAGIAMPLLAPIPAPSATVPILCSPRSKMGRAPSARRWSPSRRRFWDRPLVVCAAFPDPIANSRSKRQ